METIDNILREQTAELVKPNAFLKGGIQEHEKTKMYIGESHKDIEHLISSIPTILIGLSKNNEVLYWNAKAETVFDTIAAEVMGLPLGQCGVDWNWDKVVDGISQSRIENRPTRLDDVGFRKPDGEERYLGLTINPLNGDNDSILGLVIIGADITDRKKMEARLQQSQKMEAIGQLAAGIAHEINTPTQFVGDNTRFFQDAFVDLVEIINTYKELIETARSSSLTDELIKYAEEQIEELDFDYLLEEVPLAIQHTLKGVDRIAKIVRAMKIFAHPGMSEKELTPINKEIEKTITITRNEWKYVAELITDFDLSLPPVPCFRAELNQVILNMIVNAAHATAEVNKDNPSQKGTIHISTRHEGNWAKIYISDTGAGIPEDIREKIFDLFFTTKAAGKGSGQGLPYPIPSLLKNTMVQSILRVRKETGQPLLSGFHWKSLKSKMTEIIRKQILFVDDEPLVLKGLQRTLRKMRNEWDMMFTSSGKEALDILSKEAKLDDTNFDFLKIMSGIYFL